MLRKLTQKLSGIGLLVGIATLLVSSSASAHVVVKPAEVVTAGFHSFTVGVPNEKEIPTTSVRLVIPEGLKYVTPVQKPGWAIDVEKEGEGEAAVVKSIVWSGSVVNAGFRDDFAFSAQVPAEATEIQWKAYQTYSDGTVVAWDKASTGDGHDDLGENTGPFSVTKVVTETAAQSSVKAANQSASNANRIARSALAVGAAGVLVGLVGIHFATRSRKK